MGESMLLSCRRTPAWSSNDLFSGFLRDTGSAVLGENPSIEEFLLDMPSVSTIDRSDKRVAARKEPLPQHEPRERLSLPIFALSTGNRTRTREKRSTPERASAHKGSAKKFKHAGKQVDGIAGFSLCQRAEIEASKKHWDTAFELWEEALQVQREVFGERHGIFCTTLSRRGLAYAEIGLWYESILDLERAVHIRKEYLDGGDDQCDQREATLSTAKLLVELGKVQQKHGSYVDAMESLEKCLEDLKGLYGENHPGVACIVCMKGNFYHQRRRYGQALKQYNKGLAIYSSAGVPANDPRIVWTKKCISDRNIAASRFLNMSRKVSI